MEKLGIYKMDLDCGRRGSLTGVFTATNVEVDNLIGSYVYFGEVLGKHSEVCGYIEKHEITLVTDEENVVKLFIEHNLSSGYNPFNYTNDEGE